MRPIELTTEAQLQPRLGILHQGVERPSERLQDVEPEYDLVTAVGEKQLKLTMLRACDVLGRIVEH
ncbi:MAG: hypothetical protein AVDCRST_MAG93-7330 [uncultured Chloroflexia bacterium]|uniref:Uncharacterized protein n=1 Tax=uncultured Chloroflexia bacterium TaxID=1672391 RepID=A0A6J4ME36_9CHLR|nr:MAG: hypothetical protein AVDCRST_MAG93-7330 [uncultured Chloroflexia bacterium]